ncbi:OsmC family protein [Nocardioides houyundeii]|uniref:OsmC family protein n=1 Tax=Nocardioides houyundeii TaxID=2045452 RepID=UPI000C7781B5|nr:OsmC family protein [Nocardioides houyundeii]
MTQTPGSSTESENSRSVTLTRIGDGRFKATNARGGETFFGTGGLDPDFTPVELLLAAIAGCSAIDVDLITGKRSEAVSFDVACQGEKVRDEQGNHLRNIRVVFDVRFPDGDAGDQARAVMPRAIAQTRDRLCTVSRTVALGEPVVFEDVNAQD